MYCFQLPWSAAPRCGALRMTMYAACVFDAGNRSWRVAVAVFGRRAGVNAAIGWTVELRLLPICLSCADVLSAAAVAVCQLGTKRFR